MKLRTVFLRVIVFLCILAVLTRASCRLFRIQDYRVFQMLEGIKKEPAGTIDCVFIGGSNVYSYWNPLLAYEDFGFTSWTYAVPGQPNRIMKNMLIEARKSQPDALYVLSLNGFKRMIFPVERIHMAVDYVGLSANKLNMIDILCDAHEIPLKERLEYLLPVIRFHSGWSTLTSEDFDHPLEELKGTVTGVKNFVKSTDQSSKYIITDDRSELSEELLYYLNDLLDYCRDENINVIFTMVPQALGRMEEATQLNAVTDYVKAQGFTVLDQMQQAEDMSLDMKTDMRDHIHANIHGAIKYTAFTGKILKEMYDFPDAREDGRAESWNRSLADYREIMDPVLYPFERVTTDRDLNIAFPGEFSVESAGKGITVRFGAVAGAEGYEIYRRKPVKKGELPKTAWELAADVKAEESQTEYVYTDRKDIEIEDSYEYSVVPYGSRNGEKIYGECCYSGSSASAGLDTPVLLGVSIREDGSRELAWSSVDGAESYVVYKKAEGGKYSKVAVVKDGCTYTDAETDQPEIYTVRAACKGSGGDTVYSDYDKEGVRAE